MSDLAERLTMFIKDLDFFDYMDSLEIDETDDDALEKTRAMLENPILVRSAAEVLEDVLKDGTLDEELEERDRCQGLLSELRSLYREQLQSQKVHHTERSTR